MTAVVALLVTSVAVTLGAPELLTRGRWRFAHPRLAVRVWLVAFGAGVGSLAASLVVAAAIVLARGEHPSGGVAIVLLTVFAWSGLAAAGGVGALLLVRAEPIAAARHRGGAAVTLLAARSAVRVEAIGDDTVLYVESEQAIACSTADGRILVSTAVERAMPALSLRAVVEHERAHIRLRHDLVLRLASLGEAAFPFLASAREFRRTVALLAELIADDEAARLCGPAAVCTALAAMRRLDDDASLPLRERRIAARPIRSRSRTTALVPARAPRSSR